MNDTEHIFCTQNRSLNAMHPTSFLYLYGDKFKARVDLELLVFYKIFMKMKSMPLNSGHKNNRNVIHLKVGSTI